MVRAARLTEGARVADFAAGGGFFARAAARAVAPLGRVWAVDADPELLARLKNLAHAEGIHTVEVVRGNVEKPGGSNLEERSVDWVILVNGLFSSHNKGGIAAEASRVLRRGGKVLLVEWKDSFGGLGPAPEHVVSAAAATQTFAEHGFALVGDIPAGPYHWGCILQKKA